ncbi:uncharacterized protein LOC131662991 [Phymastichus coffea]|uniref:uncharacterized protein LOC131662991 n=1 Tax=Phymastichus coffea TaxID=108790 RepID=UPI00273B81FA|nr:uncharacterized protein LOC131662991 [Phymastichus coffea]
MIPTKRELTVIVLFGVCLLSECLASESVSVPKILNDASEDFPYEDNAGANKAEHTIVKRVVDYSVWSRKQSERLAIPNSNEWVPSAQRPRYHHETDNAKWQSSRGHNNFNVQGLSNKEDDEWYEGVSSESNKPRKEKLPRKPASDSTYGVVAKYDPAIGAQCPTLDATGLFVYPPDCKFYVTCWNGRAFVQPCAPGLLFSPDSLECDFPNKVRCYGSEIADFPSASAEHSEVETATHSSRASSSEEPWRLSCPLNFSGLTALPGECTKYLQCADGRAHLMECGPGTVFNPALTTCDHPRNAKGCEGAVAGASHEDRYYQPAGPPTDRDFGQSSQGSRRQRIECPSDFSGLLPHPGTCAKYLQCANGITYQMDCGVGTVFNPMTTLCDWPHNVPSCQADHGRNSYEQTEWSYSQPAGRGSPTNRGDQWHDAKTDSYYGAASVTDYSQYEGSTYVPPAQQPSASVYTRQPSRYYQQPGKRPSTTSSRGPLESRRPELDASHPINGHAQPIAHRDDDGSDVSTSSSEERYPASSPDRGYAWAVPATTRRPGRTGYGRANDHDKWSQPDTEQSGFRPSGWRGMGPGYERPAVPDRRPHVQGPNTVTMNMKPFARPVNPNIQYSNENSRSTDSGAVPPPIYLQPPKVPSVINFNNTPGHYITKNVEINQGHSNMRKQSTAVNSLNSNSDNSRIPKIKDLASSQSHHVMRIPVRFDKTTTTTTATTTTHKPDVIVPDKLNIAMTSTIQVGEPKLDVRNKEFQYSRAPMDTNLPTVSIELEEDWNSSFAQQTAESTRDTNSGAKTFWPSTTEEDSTETDGFEVEVTTSDENVPWKPQLVFKNKAEAEQRKNEESVIMRVGKHKPSYHDDVVVAPFSNGKCVICVDEPPFPNSYIPPRSSSLKLDPFQLNKPTPLSGQALRLRGGSDPSEGYVEVQGEHPGWGSVCDLRNRWTVDEASVVCKQLGYNRGASSAWQGRPKTSQVPAWIAASSVNCYGNETKFQFCKFSHKPECNVQRDAVAVRCLPHRLAHCRIDEVAHEGQCYHFAEAANALTRDEAHNYCQRRSSRLVDIFDQAENNFVSEYLMQNQPHVDSIMTSGFGFNMMNRTIWTWEDPSAAKFKFTKWWPGWERDKSQTPSAGSRPVCIIMTRKFPCHSRPDNHCKTDYFFWDVEDCAASNKGHAYICERAFDDVGCVYGNGKEYYGNASLSASGRACLSWSDPQVSRSLVSKVPDRGARDKLKSHNHCRNPNPQRESRPWCFTGPRSEYEYCDIPYCGKIVSKKSHLTGNCKPKHFECLPGECIPSPWVCDGQEDCTNGADELKCASHMSFFKKYPRRRLDGYEVEKWLNTPAKTCALRCKEADFTCRSFTHHTKDNTCYLSDSNVGLTGALEIDTQHDYYEMRAHTIDCEDMFVCANKKCVNRTKVCDGKNDCFDRSDEKVCTVQNLDYNIRLAGANSSHEGRVEVKILGKWGQVCDDSFDIIDAEVICRELGFNLGALEVRPGGFYGNMDPPESFMVDQLKCRGNESTIRECDFDGWGNHNCEPEEAVGVVCKTNTDVCQDGHWKCDNSPDCIRTSFICDEVVDCSDGSDENSAHCDAPFEIRLANGSSPMEGRVEIRHHGIWGTICDDDFSEVNAKVICRSLGYDGHAVVKKDGYFGPGTGPIWLDEVFCYGNETSITRCEHDNWGTHNCGHNEDAGVVCSAGPTPHEYESRGMHTATAAQSKLNANDVLPTECGRRLEDFDDDDELIFERVVRSSVAPRGSYPWQASIRVRGHSKSNHWCGAVVLSPLHVLTAAHCLQGYNKGTYFVRAGDYNTEIDEGTELEANIEDYYIHEDFRKGHKMNNDIALVLLKSPGMSLGRNVMPICLPHAAIDYPPGLNCTISGFGSIEPGSSTHSRDLRYGWVPILDDSTCRAERVYGPSITNGMLCAGHLHGGPDTCDGDSGGPLACLHNGAFTLYGLTSWGQHCGRANKPGVYVRIAYYRDWIDQKIKQSLGGA